MRTIIITLSLLGSLLWVSACGPGSTSETSDEQQTSAIMSTSFGNMPDGREVSLFTLKNEAGLTVTITNFGGIVTSILAPGRDGQLEDIVLGFDTLAPYLEEHPYFGAIVGRYANRIAKGRFELDGKTYTLATNNIGNHLHGGVKGFDKVLWEAEASGDTLVLRYRSPDGEEGYPGNMDVEVRYRLTADNELHIDYRAVSDQPTIVNLTNHAYFNLSGQGKGDILSHRLTLFADRFLPVDSTLIPTGELQTVAGTPFDFREPTRIGARIEAVNEQLKRGGGYDHCWILNKNEEDALSLAARLQDSTSGRFLELSTTEPAIQFYSGNFLDGSLSGKGNMVYQHRYGLCLEPEHYPDSPNRPEFPSVVLRPGEVYQSKSVYRFGVME